MPSNWTTVDDKPAIDRRGHCRNPLIQNGLSVWELKKVEVCRTSTPTVLRGRGMRGALRRCAVGSSRL